MHKLYLAKITKSHQEMKAAFFMKNTEPLPKPFYFICTHVNAYIQNPMRLSQAIVSSFAAVRRYKCLCYKTKSELTGSNDNHLIATKTF